MPRRASFVVLTALVFLAFAQPARAGGSWIEVSGSRHVRIGTWELGYAGAGTLVTMRGDFSDGQQAPVEAGPWYAYLTPDVGDVSAPVLLGSVSIAETGGYPYVATARFTAPSVPVGTYWVHVCDLGCTKGVGDLGGGSIVLGATDAEARLYARAQILTWMHREDARRIAHLRKQNQALRTEVTRIGREADQHRAVSALASERGADVEAEAGRRNAILDRAEERADLWRTVGAASFGACLFAIGLLVRSRRRARVVVPDSPAELVDPVDRDRAGV